VSVLLFLNELSCSEPHPKERVDEAMGRLVRILIQIARLRSDAALVSKVKREELELAPGYYLAEWAGQAANRDLWRFIHSLQNHAPPRDVLPPGTVEGVEYFWESRPAEALGTAHLANGLLVSLLVDDRWDQSWIRAVRNTLVEVADGGITVVYDEVEVRHAAAADHVAVHEDWLKKVGVLDLHTGSELWEARIALFPNVQFLPRVEEQMRELRPDWVIPAAQELRRIDDAIADWNPTLRPFPTWRSLITPEHEQRKMLCKFTDLDDTEQIFDLHGRFTPGAGRIHFRLVAADRKARVAHVGLKLGI
jgi:hypothetical protein